MFEFGLRWSSLVSSSRLKPYKLLIKISKDFDVSATTKLNLSVTRYTNSVFAEFRFLFGIIL